MSWDRALGIEVEWNPFSIASRAARAERTGRLGDALRLYARAGRPERIRECLVTGLPDSPLRPTLLEAADEWLALWRGLNLAGDQGLDEETLELFAERAEPAAVALWRAADRAVTVAGLDVDVPRVRQALQRENRMLRQLQAALRDARASLVERALSNTGQPADVREADQRLLHLAQAVRELEDEMESER